MQDSEKQLVAKAAKGNDDALEELLSRCDGTLRAIPETIPIHRRGLRDG